MASQLVCVHNIGNFPVLWFALAMPVLPHNVLYYSILVILYIYYIGYILDFEMYVVRIQQK